jgi:cytochrome c peroxidase
MFRTPSLRNVARRLVFMHNGIFRDLRQVVRFYATRDSNPKLWYPEDRDRIAVFNDLPEPYRGNLDRQAPFGRRPGDPPALSDQEVDDIVAFLNALNDGFKPAAP